jgi:hypothetical protein
MTSIYQTCSNKKLGFIPSEWAGVSTTCASPAKTSKRVSTGRDKLIAGVLDKSKITTMNIVC